MAHNEIKSRNLVKCFLINVLVKDVLCICVGQIYIICHFIVGFKRELHAVTGNLFKYM